MKQSCSECGLEIGTSFVWWVEDQRVCGDCLRRMTPEALWWMISAVERITEPVYRARIAAKRN